MPNYWNSNCSNYSGVVSGFPQKVSESKPWFFEEFQSSKILFKFHPKPNWFIISFEVTLLENSFSP